VANNGKTVRGSLRRRLGNIEEEIEEEANGEFEEEANDEFEEEANYKKNKKKI